MEERNTQPIENESPEGPKLLGKRFSLWFENFWYHYKWHSLISLFLIFVVVICSVQMCRKQDYDLHILYAGNKYIDRKSENGDIPEYNSILSALKSQSKDYDGDGEINISFSDKYAVSKEELDAMTESERLNKQQLLNTHGSELAELMVYGDYYLCFLSPDVYSKYRLVGENTPRFCSLECYRDLNSEMVYYSSDAIRLDSLDIYDIPGIDLLPPDTLVCLRELGEVIKNSHSEEQYLICEDMLKTLISYKKPN